jgi:hypothetical protein
MFRKSYHSLLTPIDFGLPLLLALGLLLTGCGHDDSEADRASTSPSPSTPAATDTAASIPTGEGGIVFTTANGFEAINAIQNATLARTKEGLTVHALNNDPALSLPAFKVAPGSKFTVHIQIVAPGTSDLEVMYNTTSLPAFGGHNSVRKSTHQGDNDVTVEIPDPTFAGRIRIDPGELRGDYLIKLIEVGVSARDSSTPSPTPGQ